MSREPKSAKNLTPAAGGHRVSPDTSRRNSLSLLLSLLHHQGVMSRAELTRESGFNRSTISALIGQLTELGMVYESAPSGEQRVGRPSPEVHPDQDGAVLELRLDRSGWERDLAILRGEAEGQGVLGKGAAQSRAEFPANGVVHGKPAFPEFRYALGP